MDLFLYSFIKSFWFLLPGGIANGIPPIIMKFLPNFNYPMDFNLTFRNRRIFGPHKTVRGLVGGVIGAILASYLLSYLYLHGLDKYGLFNFSTHPLLYGLVSGFGALFGDAIKSFFKRQMDIPSGTSWLVFDQADWIFGVVILNGFFTHMSVGFSLITIVTGMLLHLIIRFLGFILGIVKEII